MDYPLSHFQFLLHGIDTIEIAYYLNRLDGDSLDFQVIAVQKEALVASKSRAGQEIKLGSESFLLASHGTKSGYPYLLQNDVFIIQCGEFNRPNFFVKFRSVALWHHGLKALHERFLAWAASVGMQAYHPERISRVDFAFDYHLPNIDFDQDSFVTQAKKDHQHRKDGKVQTFTLGQDQIVLRVYNKTDEIKEASQKTWFYELWGMDQDVWRIEWQFRKQILKWFHIQTIDDLEAQQGDILRYMVNDHTTLRIPNDDTNASRWPLHRLWQNLIKQVNAMQGLGITRDMDHKAILEERLTRIAISVYGYIKRVAAIDALYTGQAKSYMDEAFTHLQNRISEIHDPLTWQQDVDRRIKEMRFGEW